MEKDRSPERCSAGTRGGEGCSVRLLSSLRGSEMGTFRAAQVGRGASRGTAGAWGRSCASLAVSGDLFDEHDRH